MANEAERVVVELLAKVDGFDGKVRQSASAFGGSMKTIEASAVRGEQATTRALANVERSMQRTGQASRNLGFQISDISTQLAAGTSPFLILAQQGPQVANALDGAKGKVGQFATFLSGPWGAALLGATTLLGVFGSKLFQTGDTIDDLVDKLKEQARKTDEARNAQDRFNLTLDGSIAKERELNEELERQLKTRGQLDRKRTASVAGDLAGAKVIVGQKNDDLTAARNRLSAARDNLNSPPPGADPAFFVGAAREFKAATAAVSAAEKSLADARKNVQNYERDLRGARAIELQEQAKGLADAKVAQRQALEGRQGQLTADFQAGKLTETAYKSQFADLEKQLNALGKSAKDAAGELTSFINPVGTGPITGQFGEKRAGRRAGYRHGGIDIAVDPGTPVKAAAAGTVITSGTLPGYGNVVIVDHGGGTITRYAHLSQRLAKKGDAVAQGQVIGASGGAKGAPGSGNSTGPHLHYEVRQGGKAVDPRKTEYRTDNLGIEAKAAEQLEKAVDAEAQRRTAFLNDLASDQADELQSRQALITAAEELAKLETEAIEHVRAHNDARIKAAEEEFKRSDGLKGLSEEEAKQRRQLNDTIAKNRTEAVARREDQRRFRMAEAEAQAKLEFSVGSLNVEQELLEAQEGIATTAKERHDLGRRLIDLQFEEERLQLEAIIAEAERLRLKKDLTEAEREELKRAEDRAKLAQDRLATQGDRRGNAQTGNDRQNASPLQSWAESVPQTADEINESLEAVAAGGLSSLADGIADAIVNFKSFGDVARSVLQMVLAEMIKLIVKMLIVKALKAVFGLADGGAVGGDSLGGAAASAAAMAGGGRVGFPTGGHVIGAGTATSDSIPAMLSNGEFVIRKKAVDGLGLQRLNDMNRTGRLPGYSEGGLVRAVSPSNAPAHAPGGRMGGSGFTENDMRRFEGVVRDAATAMPPVNLYPTLDPKHAMERMLSDPGAQRLLFGFLSDNSRRANSSLSR